jgi:pimeloyl-ACP methyl ester carboxylesterase
MTDCYEAGEGPPLVLLHGLGGSWHVWQPVLPMLERQHRVIAPTLPGHPGGALWPAGREPTLQAIADMLAQDFSERKIDRPHIGGNSLGGLLALELARRASRHQSPHFLRPAHGATIATTRLWHGRFVWFMP